MSWSSYQNRKQERQEDREPKRRRISPEHSHRSSHRHEHSHEHESRYSDRHERRHTSSRDEDTRKKDRSITEIDWNRHKRQLNAIFFKKTDYIQVSLPHRSSHYKIVTQPQEGSPEYFEYWEFLEKYIQFRQNKQKVKTNEEEDVDREERLPPFDFSSKYDDRYLINFSILLDKHVKFTREEGESKDRLSEGELLEFRKVLHLYENFCQKKKIQKLIKIKQDRENLPIAKYKDTILQRVKEAIGSAVIIAGDTGCGKSTQVVQYLLEANYTSIACTQPRRIATMALARRVSYETLNEYGSQIAYQIRFDSSRTSKTKAVFLTEGLLLRQLASDPLLKRYNVIIVDEVHERHIHGDFLLGILRELITKRTDLKLILMSATINVQLFSDYFNNAPIVLVPGRLFPISVEYIPIEQEAPLMREKNTESEKKGENSKSKNEKNVVYRRARINPKPYLMIMERIDQQFPADERGDLLIFVSGMDEILVLADEIKKYANYTKRWIVLMLHSALSVEEQDKVFDIAPDGVRKCIISTNIAETSVTIDGIRFCIDSGKSKEMGYDPESKMQRLQEFWISKASAEQRKGRAGRTGPGHCFRLYSQQDYESFLNYPVPEIQRITLSSVVLQVKALGLGDPRDFNFIEKPTPAAIEESMETLKRIGAVEGEGEMEEITPLGHVLSKLPVDVAIGKILVLGTIFHIVEPLLTVCAALSVQSPFLRNASEDSITLRNRFMSEEGDPFTLLNLYSEWLYMKTETRDNTKKWCRRHGIEEQRLYEISKLRQQFKELLRDCKLIQSETGEEGVDDMDEEDGGKKNFFGMKLEKGYIKRKKRELRMIQIEREQKRGRRVLTLDTEYDAERREGEEEEDVDEIDLRDIDFKLSHDARELQRSSGRELSRQDINLIKVILFSGLYPNSAIGDEFNANHKESEQVFHTPFKQFASLHPTSVFSGRSNMIKQNDLLCYEKLLETNKPWLTNVFKTPALHSLMLFARCVDTNKTFTKFVIDNWLLIEIEHQKAGEKILIVIHQLRLMLKNLLEKKLTKNEEKKEEEEMDTEDEIIEDYLPSFLKKMKSRKAQKEMLCSEEELSHKLAEFLECPIAFKMSRLKQSEILAIFTATKSEFEEKQNESEKSEQNLDPMQQLEVSHETKKESFDDTKSGIKINEWLRFGSVLEKEQQSLTVGFSSHMKKHFTCEKCGESFMFNLDEVKQHISQCTVNKKKKKEESVKSNAEDTQQEVQKAHFKCDICGEELMLTALEMLKHKRKHKEDSTKTQ